MASGAVTGLAAASAPMFGAATPAKVVGLKADYLDCPLGLNNPNPRFSWRLESQQRGARQNAYRIFVASSESLAREGHGDLWDTGKVLSGRTFGVTYGGQALQSRQRCWWRVQVWDQLDMPSDLSAISWWETGLMSLEEWSAQWLAAEDSVAQADRKYPLSWIWGSDPDARSRRRFHSSFQLPQDADEGVLYVFGRNDPQEYVSDVWVDGEGLGAGGPARNLAGEPLVIGPLRKGGHQLAIEVEIKRYLAEELNESQRPAARGFGIAAFARLTTKDREAIRLTSGLGWRTSLACDPHRRERPDDDPEWEEVTAVAVEHSPIPDPTLYLRRDFTIKGAINSARLYVSALGFYEARLNGARIGDALMDPPPWMEAGQGQIRRLLFYRTYDVAKQLQPGRNTLGLTLSGGWYRAYGESFPARVIAQLEVAYADGSKQALVTGPDWQTSRSPILYCHPLGGEMRDARLEQDGWDKDDFRGGDWEKATIATAPGVSLIGDCVPPIRATQFLTPQSIKEAGRGTYLFDFGQVFAGRCRLQLKGSPGARVDLQFAEDLTASGELDSFVHGGLNVIDTYILRGDPNGETFEPQFSYHGIRYVRVTGVHVAPALLGVVIHNDLKFTGQFRIDSSLVQRIWRNTVWSQRGNFQGVPFALPDRVDFLGSISETEIFWDAAPFIMDVAAYTERWMNNERGKPRPDGLSPNLVDGDFEWLTTTVNTGYGGFADGCVSLPWTIWHRYGDVGIIEQNWAAMDRCLQYALERNPTFIWRHWNIEPFGDWLAPGERHWYQPEVPPTTPLELICTAYWVRYAEELAQMAEATDRIADALRLRAVAGRVRDAFVREFVTPDGRVGTGSQTSYILALKFDLLPDNLRRVSAERLVADVRARGIALSTGSVGTQFSLDVLADAGYSDIVYSLLLRSQYPSWGYMIDHGATTMWESWDGALDHRHNEAAHNYYVFGSICGFMFRRIAGIDVAEPGFKRIEIRPLLDPHKRVRRAGADYDSIMGRISSDWVQGEDAGFSLRLTIPANTSARVHLPAHRGSRITEGRTKVSLRKAVRILERFDDKAVVEVGSGSYMFVVENK